MGNQAPILTLLREIEVAMRNLFSASATIADFAISPSAFAQSTPTAEATALIEGWYYGRFFNNETGEMAASLMLEDASAATADG